MNNTGKDISIIVQGAVNKYTADCIDRLNRLFPASQIILSTWENSDVSGIRVEKIVQSEDPGCVIVDPVTNTMNNVNRQLRSTLAGLQYATRPYILKTRSDLLFHDTDFLQYFAQYDEATSPYFQNRLLICNYYSRNPRVFETCFHPSDWITFGRAEDVRKYYENIPLMSDEDGNWFRQHEKKSTFFTNYLSRFTPEQYIFLSFLKQHEQVHCECYYDCNETLIRQTEKAFAECFVVLDYQKQLNIIFPKYHPNRYMEKHTLISHWQWKALYYHYCLGKNSFLWLGYRMRARGIAIGIQLRLILIQLMDMMGIKEKMKSLLNRFVSP